MWGPLGPPSPVHARIGPFARAVAGDTLFQPHSGQRTFLAAAGAGAARSLLLARAAHVTPCAARTNSAGGAGPSRPLPGISLSFFQQPRYTRALSPDRD